METSIKLAFLNHAKHESINAKRLAKARAKRPYCSCRALEARVVEWYNRRQNYSHVEFVIPETALGVLTPRLQRRVKRRIIDNGQGNEDVSVLAFGAFGDGGVQVLRRPFTNEGYDFIDLVVNPAQFKAAVEFAAEQVGKPYDGAGASMRLILWPAQPTHERWWCASLVHAILKKTGMLLHNPLNMLDVDDLFVLVKHSKRRMGISATPLQIQKVRADVEGRMFGAYASGTPSVFGTSAHDLVDAAESSCRNIVELGLADDDEDETDDSIAQSNFRLVGAERRGRMK